MQSLDFILDKIDEAQAEGDHKEVAALWRELNSSCPHDNEQHILAHCQALRRVNAWLEADNFLQSAIERFSNSSKIEMQYALNAVSMHNWQVAADRLVAIQEKYDARNDSNAYTAIYEELLVYHHMMDHEKIEEKIQKCWVFLKNSIPHLSNALFNMHNMVGNQRFEEFTFWSRLAVPEAHRGFYEERLKSIAENSAWIAAQAPNLEIVSLGQNCLPYILLDRWGMRLHNNNIATGGPFDVLPGIEDMAVDMIKTDFVYLLDRELWGETKYPSGSPVLLHGRYKTQFFHEQGPWWAAKKWHRLENHYQRKIDNFRTALSRKQRVFIFCICGKCDIEQMVEMFISRLDSPDSRLLILNIQADPVPLLIEHPHVTNLHRPYPEDYAWNTWQSYDSDRGSSFERLIVEDVRSQINAIIRPVAS
jgi:tetratricopeptide (TPR) repeat protein